MNPSLEIGKEGEINVHHLFSLLSAESDGEHDWPRGKFVLDEANNAIVMTLADYADLTATISQQESQWMVSVPVAPVESIKDRIGFNEMAMRMGVVLPLVSVGISDINREPYYVAYGQLYAESKLASICSEIHATASAALQLAEIIGEEYV